jgi:hypothetical protein
MPHHVQARGVFVVGMHRSGTSATTRVLNLLGVPLRTREDALPHTAGNERGHWESRSLMQFNERLLRELGARWNDIPPLNAPVCGWHRLAAHGAEARLVFHSAHPTPTWAWKDPRLCVLLPFWRTVLPEPHGIVLVLRDPLEIAASLAARDGLAVSTSLLQWERSLGHALLGCVGAPTYVLRYPDLLDDPVAVCGDLLAFLNELGMGVTEADEQVRAFLSPQLRHSRHESARSPLLTRTQRSLLATLDELSRVHPSFEPPITHPAATPQQGSWGNWFHRATDLGCAAADIRAAASAAGLTSSQIEAGLRAVATTTEIDGAVCAPTVTGS